MKIEIASFRGMAPRVTSRALPANAAQDATNTRLQTGDLEAWRQFALTKTLANAPPVESIYLLNDKWLSWGSDVDVARSTVSGDTSFRAYLTGPDEYAQPQFTDYALATTGAEPFPVTTRPLGVPAPESPPTLEVGTGANPDVSVLDSGDQLTAWTTSGTVSNASVSSDVSQDAAVGNPAPSYKLLCRNNVSQPAFAYRDFGVGSNAAVTMTTDFNPTSNGAVLEASWRVGVTAAGGGAVVKVGYPADPGGGLFLMIGTSDAWGQEGSWLEQIPMSPLDGSGTTWYSAEITLTRNTNGTSMVTARIFQGSGLLAEASVSSGFLLGGYCGIEMVTAFTLPAFYTHYDNISVQGSGASDSPTLTATSYLYTFVNDLGQESAPSPVSSTVLRPDGVSVTVTTPTSVPSGVSASYGVDTKRIYRAVTGSTGTVFRFVAEIPLGTATYADALTDSELGEVLQSELWALPPDDLKGILALPNGIMVGFRANQLCFSAQNQPHAWPVEYRLNTDTAIVGIGNIDNTVVIGTESFPYLATGNDPAAYSMSKLEAQQACVSKQSVAYVLGIGVVFATPDGLLAVLGNGQVQNLTRGIFTRQQWEALAPETIRAYSHDNIYFFFYDLGSNGRGGYALDMAPDGFGLISLAFFATAMYADPLTDKLYVVLTEDNEPTEVYLPLPSTAPSPTGVQIYEFDAETGNGHVVYRWRGKLNLLSHPSAFAYCKVEAEDFTNLALNLYGDGDLLVNTIVTSEDPFTLPMTEDYHRFEIELVGTSRVRTVQVANDVMEFD